MSSNTYLKYFLLASTSSILELKSMNKKKLFQILLA